MSKLVLHPADPDCSVDSDQIRRSMLALGFTGNEQFIHAGRTHHHAGEGFLDLLTFVGCSPVVMTGDENIGQCNFYHIHYTDHYPDPRAVVSEHARPRCPQCKAPLANWHSAIKAWEEEGRTDAVVCEKCGADSTIFTLNWKRGAGIARFYIEIHGVFPHEAIPSDSLLGSLAALTGTGWDYFYYS